MNYGQAFLAPSFAVLTVCQVHLLLLLRIPLSFTVLLALLCTASVLC